MKTISTIIAISLILQSCYTYKDINFDDMKINKNYEIKLENGQTVSGISEKNIADSIFLRINTNTVKFPKNKIESIKRKKVSSLMVISIVAVMTGGIIILLNDQQNINEPTSSY